MHTGKVLYEAAKARVLELEDRVAALCFCAQDGRIDSATAKWAADALRKIEQQVDGVIIMSDTENFCTGTDTDEIAVLMSEGNWTGLEEIPNRFQELTRTIRGYSKPVVTLATGLTMDIGMEMVLCSAAVMEAEAVFGFAVERNGLPPMGGGLTELALRTYAIGADVPGHDILPFLKRVFTTVYGGKPCAGTDEAVKRGLPLPNVRSCSKEELLSKGKREVLHLMSQGYVPRTDERIITVPGATGAAALEIMTINTQLGGFISEKLLHLASDIARVLSIGGVPKGTLVTEGRFLECERSAFIQACRRTARKEELV